VRIRLKEPWAPFLADVSLFSSSIRLFGDVTVSE